MAGKSVDQAKKFIHFLQHDLWKIELGSASKLKAFGVEALRVIHLVLKSTKDDNCKLHASALTYSTLMAMVPLLVMVFAISSAIGFETAKQNLLVWAERMPDLLPFVEQLIGMVESVQIGALGSLGGVFLLYIIFKLLNGIEESFNQIWGVQASRSITDKVRNYISVLVIAPILMLVSTVATPTIMAFLGSMDWLGPVAKILIRLFPIGILSMAFLAIFMFLPNTKVSARPALVGSVVSAIMVVILQVLMIKAGIGVTRLGQIYGTFAYIPIFLFWLYMSWAILLFGAELAFAIQHRGTYQEEQRAVRASMVSKLWVAFAVMQEAVRVFQSEEPSFDEAAYARSNNIPIRLMNEVVGVLVREQLIGAVGGDGQEGYALLRAPEDITAKRVYDLMITDGSSPEELGLVKIGMTDQILSSANSSLGEILNPITLRKFFDGEK